MKRSRLRRWAPLLLVPVLVIAVERFDREDAPEVEASERVVLEIAGDEVPIYIDIGQPRHRFLGTVGIGGDSNVLVFGDEEPRCVDPGDLQLPVTVVFFTRSGLVRGVFELDPTDLAPACLDGEETPRFALVTPRGRASIEVGERIGIPKATIEHLGTAEFLVGY